MPAFERPLWRAAGRLQGRIAPLHETHYEIDLSPTLYEMCREQMRRLNPATVRSWCAAADRARWRLHSNLLLPCCPVTVAFDDDAVAEFFDRQIDTGRRPEQFGRIWIHTHPGDCANPSSVDEETFARVFARSDWAVMAIVACGGQTYARLRFHVGPGGSLLLPMAVDYRQPFAASQHDEWTDEYHKCVHPEPFHWYSPLFDDWTCSPSALSADPDPSGVFSRLRTAHPTPAPTDHSHLPAPRKTSDASSV